MSDCPFCKKGLRDQNGVCDVCHCCDDPTCTCGQAWWTNEMARVENELIAEGELPA